MKDTAFYNYYNISYRYTPDTPKTPAWKENLKIEKDKVKSNNRDPEGERYKALNFFIISCTVTEHPYLIMQR